MTPNKFQKDCVKSIDDLHLTRGDETLMGLMTMNGMAGECIDIYKKVLYQGRPFDREEFAWRLRNIVWGVAVCAHGMDYRLEDILKAPEPDSVTEATDAGNEKGE
jgi:hypothetical protein